MLTIAVDGYASSGKGTVCRELAKKLGIIHFDTGAIYRVIGLYCINNNIDPYDQELVENSLSNINVNLDHIGGEQVTYLNGLDVSEDIRSSIVSDVCSITSAYPRCREFVLNIQRQSAKSYDLVMEGRDITSHVLPDANFKFMLTADIKTRAKRRYIDLSKSDPNITLEQVERDLLERDRRDTTRELSPLILTEGTIYIDNTNMTINDEVDLMFNIIKGEC